MFHNNLFKIIINIIFKHTAAAGDWWRSVEVGDVVCAMVPIDSAANGCEWWLLVIEALIMWKRSQTCNGCGLGSRRLRSGKVAGGLECYASGGVLPYC